MIYRNKKKQNYDHIIFETFGDHSDWVLESSQIFLIIEEVEALRSDLVSMTTKTISNDIDQLNLDKIEDDAQLNFKENMDKNNDIVVGKMLRLILTRMLLMKKESPILKQPSPIELNLLDTIAVLLFNLCCT
ncbi:unnamed protein product [Lathyrus oleraceus]